ncbi:MAG TPA: flagellar filament capping protein FliD [Anaerohalosphaeraceae bacterium]|nr:flagellar filament capping protein FliD [Anaerohalosphaeraceae bacterium]HOL87658.1 flagellar filament capping protein FliD [Anaerohalosphaeraceae bacterium]HPP55835.1 flagellar filament capping protein FliD [Anaerohalosphaeraceae bacterium]
MASIQLTGLSTGIDTAAIVEQLMQVEKRRLTSLQSSLATLKDKRTAVTDLNSKLTSFRSALSALSDSSQLRTYQAKTSDEDLLTATAGSSAFEGTHNIKIRQLATANRWVHNGFNYKTQYVGEGNLILSYNNKEFVVQTTATTTLEELVTLINNDPDNPGITASILDYQSAGGRYHLVLSGRESGSDYQIAINTSNTDVHTSSALKTSNGDNASLTTRLSQLQGSSGFGTGSTSDQIRIQGTLRDGTPVDYSFDVNQYTTVEELMSEIENAFGDTVKVRLEEGTLILTDRTSGTSNLSISLELVPGEGSSAVWTAPTFTETTVGGSITSNLTLLAPSTFLETQAAQDAMIKVDGYPPGDDTDENTWIRRSTNTIDDVIAGVTLNLHSATGNDTDGYRSVEVTLNRDTTTLKDKLQAMVDAYNAAVSYLKEKTTYNEEEKKTGILSSEYSLTSITSLIRSPLLFNAAGFTDKDTFVKPADIGIKFKADGTLTLDSAKLEEALVDDYQGVLSLIGAKKTGYSSSNTIQFYQASSYTQGGQYDVRVTVEGGVITSAQIKLNTEDWSAARDMRIEGNTLYGSTDTISSGYPAHPEYSLVLTVDTSQNGSFDASVSVKQGFAGNLYDVVDNMLKVGTGRVSMVQKSVQSRIDNMDGQISREEERLSRVETRLKNQYARLERTLQLIQQQMSGLNMLG